MSRGSLASAIWAIAVQGVDIVSGIVASIAVARLLGPVPMGSFTFAFAVTAMLGLFVIFGADALLVEAYSIGRATPEKLLGAALRLLGVGILICATLTGGVHVFMTLSGDTVLALWLALAALVTNAVARIFGHPILAMDASARDLPCMLASRAVLVGVVLWSCWHESLAGAVLSYVAAGAVLAVTRGWVVHRYLFRLRPDFDAAVFRRLFERARHIGVAEVGAEVTSRIDVPMLEAMTTTYAVGLYGACYRVITGLYAGSAAVGRALFPGLVTGLSENRMSATRRLYTLFPLAVSGTITVAAFTVDRLLVQVLYGERYLSAAPVMRMLLLASACATIAYFLSNYALAVHRERVLPPMHLSAAALNICLNLVLIPRYSAWGAALATLVCEAMKVTWLGLIVIPIALARRRTDLARPPD